VELHQIAADTALQWLRHVRAGLTTQMHASGELQGKISCGMAAQNSATNAWDCAGAVHLLHAALLLPGLAHPLTLPELDLVRANAADSTKKNGHGRSTNRKENNKAAGKSVPLAFTLDPARLTLGSGSPAIVTGALTPQGYSVSMNGPAELETLLPIAQALGWAEVSNRAQAVQGRAVLALTRQGVWLAPAEATGVGQVPQSAWSGMVQLQNTKITLAHWPGWVQLAAATVHLEPGAVLLDKMHGSYQQQSFEGSLRYSTAQQAGKVETPCSFHLHAAVWTPGQMHLWKQESSGAAPRWLTAVQRWMGDLPTLPDCMGTLQADRVALGAVVVNHAALNIHMHGQQADFSSVQGGLWGGTVQGSGSLERGETMPVLRAQIEAHGIQAAAIAAALHAQRWGSGALDAHLHHMTAQGWTVQQMAASAQGRLGLQWNSGTWNASPLAATSLAKFQRISLQGIVQNEAVEIHQGDLLAATRHTQVTGAVSFSGALHLELQPGGVQVQGTLAHPVLMVAAEQGAAKPTP
jgi:hypothetical protein